MYYELEPFVMIRGEEGGAVDLARTRIQELDPELTREEAKAIAEQLVTEADEKGEATGHGITIRTKEGEPGGAA